MISDELRNIISTSTFTVQRGSWIYAKVSGDPKVEDAFMISRDADEITAVFELSNESKFEVIEKNPKLRKLIEVKVSKPFYATGFLAAITKAISERGNNNLLVSTYSKDYVLVQEDQFDSAKQALLELGFKENQI